MKVDKTVMDTGFCQNTENEDAFEAIFALNMGDFVAEHLISDELLNRIDQSISKNPERLKKQLQELVEIYSLNNTLSLLGFNARQGFVLYDSMAMSLAKMLEVDACHVFQTSYQSDREAFLSLSGTSVADVPQTRWNLGYDLNDDALWVVEAYHDNFPMVVPEFETPASAWKPLPELNQDKVQAFIAVPLVHQQKRIGLILFESYEAKEFSQEMVDLSESVANLLVISWHLQQLLEQAQKLISQEEASVIEMRSLRAQLTDTIADLGRTQQFFVESLAYAIDARNDFTQGQAQGVAQIAKGIADTMGLSEKTIDLVYYAGLLASLGKIQIPQDILTKEEALTPEEWEMLRSSSNMGVGLLMKINFLAEVIPYVHYQKERWDGKESPNGLAGKSIPLGARIVAVADAYHALTHPRPYRPEPLSAKSALAVLQSEAGSKWDPDVIDSLVKMVSASAA